MNDTVIDAAYEAFKQRARTIRAENDPCTNWHWDGEEEVCIEWDDRSAIEAAIRAADAHRAEAVREAVRALELDAQRYGVFPSPQGGIRLRASRAALLRLVGAEDSE